MQADQAVGIDLPLKALAYQDASGKVWLTYNEPAWLARRYGVEAVPTVASMAVALEAVATKATR